MRLLTWRKNGPDRRRRYVVSVRQAGLGDRLICLCAAWVFARRTNRTLVVEWRGAIYLEDERNLFPACFEVRSSLAGVPFIATTDGFADLPQPRYPDIWNIKMLARKPWLAPQIKFARDDAVKLIRSGDIDVPTVVLDDCVNDGVVSWRDARSFMEALRPAPRIAAAVDGFMAARSGPLIGLHLRHGNGGDILGYGRYWTSFEAAIERCCQATAMARARIGSHAMVLLCSDSVEAQREILKRIPGTLVRPKQFRPIDAGELHDGKDAALGLDDALVEMLLLARCDVLIRYPPDSFFSFLGAMLKTSAIEPPPTVYGLQMPWDPDDALSPAVLF